MVALNTSARDALASTLALAVTDGTAPGFQASLPDAPAPDGTAAGQTAGPLLAGNAADPSTAAPAVIEDTGAAAEEPTRGAIRPPSADVPAARLLKAPAAPATATTEPAAAGSALPLNLADPVGAVLSPIGSLLDRLMPGAPTPSGETPGVPSETEGGAASIPGDTGPPEPPTLLPQTAATAINPIVLENQKTGNPESEWGIEGSGSANIQGFATSISVNHGQTVDFKIATDSTDYRIDIYRLGYYDGMGARKVATIDRQLTTAQVQPHPLVDYSTGLIDCGNWSVSASWDVPADAVSGVYIAKLVREDGTEGASHIPFIVRDDEADSDITFQTSDTTWQAYNAWGGASLYGGNVPTDPADLIGWTPPNCSCGLTAIGRATKVSYNRPFITTDSPYSAGPQDWIFGVEHSAIRWLEQNGYDVNYISGVDTDRDAAQLLNTKMFLSVGHDEYWSGQQRTNVEAARDAGVNLAFWSGNEVYWKTRWETSIDGSGTPYRTLVTYKETWGDRTDPSNTGTGTWRDPRFADPGQEPENSLTGTMFTVDAYRLDTITIPYDYSNLRFWRNTDVADLEPGQTYSLVQNLLGYEWDSDVDNGFRPAGLINLSLSTVSVDTYLRDYGTSVGSATVDHSLTMYRAESGALVFGAGTVYWSWGLDDNHDNEATPVDPNVQQAMVNMFADMGIQPGTLQASLIMATGSTDHTAPTAAVLTPANGTGLVEGQRVVITGTAQDFGGGIVAGVEVSTDGGITWRKAAGRESWSYAWNAQAAGTYVIMARAADDSVNLGAASTGVSVTVTLPSTESMWTFANTPAQVHIQDRNAVELGMRFSSNAAGTVTGVRFYKGFYNQGTHTGSLWSVDGTLLATATFTNETLEGWQTVTFSNPVSIQPGTTYVVSYHSNGFYSADAGYFDVARTNGHLTAPVGAGVYAYGTSSLFPSNVYQNENFWVDALFTPGPGGGNVAPVANNDNGLATNQGVALTIQAATLLANDADPNGDPLTVTGVGNAVNGTVSFDSQSGAVTFTPTAGYSGPASFTYAISDGRGGTATGTANLTVNPPGTGLSLWSTSTTPGTVTVNDGSPVELGVKFVASSNGTITGIRFYKGAQNTGPHTASLWTATGTLLATATFTGETATGWQTVTFANPVAISSGTTYVASYHTNGNYSADSGYFSASYSNGPLSTPANAGVYAYGGSSLFPTNSWNASNYWVDVLYNQSGGASNQPPTAVADDGFSTAQNAPLAIAAGDLLANDTDPNGDALTVTGVSNPINGAVSLNSQTNTITFTPTAGFTGPASFTYTISDGRGGTASATVDVTVRQAGDGVSLFLPTDTPATVTEEDPNSVELGMKFTASAGGTITGIRFYKGPQNTGAHTGSLWTASGTLLATATFTGETATGWQTVTFANPVAISAGTTYVASYHTSGHYSATGGYFTTSRSNGPLTAPVDAGVYAYSGSSLFPTNSWNASNYWVDVVYNQSGTGTNQPPTAVADSGLSTGRDAALSIPTSTLLANDTDPNGDALTVTGVSNPANGTVTLNSQTNTVTFTPTAGFTGTASFTYAISDGRGGTASATASLTVAPPPAGSSLFSASDTPAIASVNDPSPVELGMKFQADVAGTITALRYYKSAQDTGTHEGHLWTATGQLLATATFTNETASGWQTAVLAQPVAIDANTTYIASYHSNGHYAATPNYFADDVVNGHLRALADATGGGNGVFAYGASGSFPNGSFNRTNYSADVVFNPQLAAA
ncbi:DUF4082 domain-containing protein [Inquilinus sp. NPDC058860]|uniref:DUF4082 domain-containing protein n=1 Tax=Inquilinus sp. NPDC058860 TaxID=3346652 RepID=UPI003698418C